MRFSSIRLWASTGILVIAAGMPYCAAAVGWAATQDENSITVRADVAVGVLASWIGCTILAIAGVLWTWRWWRARRTAVRASARAQALSRA
jgi:hypothetical protein